jgi:hypothetical protein
MLLALDAKNTHTLAGWCVGPGQLLYLRNASGHVAWPAPIPTLEFIEYYCVSDSPLLMKSKGRSSPSRDILEQIQPRIPHCHVNSMQGGTSKTIKEQMKEWADNLPMQKCEGKSAVAQGHNTPSGVQHSDAGADTTTAVLAGGCRSSRL